MIPKKIHYCWLSGDPYPAKIKHCIDSWHRLLPDYEIILWDKQRFPLEQFVWAKEAYDKKKYAFAADLIRLYAIFHEGGIYLDSDVEVLQKFDKLLNLPYFIGKEGYDNRVEVAAFGAEKGTPWIKKCLDYYEGRHFVKGNGELDTTVMPDVVQSILLSNYIIKSIDNVLEFENKNECFYVFPNDWFCANVHINPHDLVPTYIISENTFCVHHFANSWQKINKPKLFLKRILIRLGIVK